MTDREMIHERVKAEGYSVQRWTTTDDGETAVLGSFMVATDDYDDDGLYYEDEGELSACVVGAEKYNNRRVCFSFVPDGYDGSVEVRDLTALDPVG